MRPQVTRSTRVPSSRLNTTLYALLPTTHYTVRVVADSSNPDAGVAGFVSPPSLVGATTGNSSRPGCPPPAVRVSYTGGSLTMQLSPPIDMGGSPLRGYVVELVEQGQQQAGKIQLGSAGVPRPPAPAVW